LCFNLNNVLSSSDVLVVVHPITNPENMSTPTLQRKPSASGLVSDMGHIGPAGVTRPKHVRTATGYGAAEHKAVQSQIPESERAAWKKHSAREFKTKEEFEVSGDLGAMVNRVD
jgi:hypothetical protein